MFYFGETLQSMLDEHKLDPKTFRDETKTANSVVYDTLNNKAIPRVNTLLVWCKYFNCSIDYLIGRTSTYSPMPKNTPLDFKTIYDKLNAKQKINKSKIFKSTGIREANINRWIKGENKPTTESLIKLADYFGCSVDYLVGIER